jgi:hypothetical protein
VWPWEQRGKKPWKTDDGLRLIGMMIRPVEKGTTLTWGLGLSSDPGSGAITAPATKVAVAAPPAAVAAAGAPGGDHLRMVVVAAGSGADVPLRVAGLGASHLGPACSPLTLLGGLRNEQPVSTMQPVSPFLLRPPGATWGGGIACSPFALVQGAGGHGGIGAGSHTDGLGTPYRCIRDPDPAEGVPAAGLANRHATVIEGRQCGQDHRPQPWVIIECWDVLGEYQGFRDKSLPSNPPTRSSSSSQDRSVPGPR